MSEATEKARAFVTEARAATGSDAPSLLLTLADEADALRAERDALRAEVVRLTLDTALASPNRTVSPARRAAYMKAYTDLCLRFGGALVESVTRFGAAVVEAAEVSDG